VRDPRQFDRAADGVGDAGPGIDDTCCDVDLDALP
jgi:hypothetical protein